MKISHALIRFAAVAFGAFLVAGCGERPGALGPSVTDSAGIQILQLPESAWAAVGALELSPTTFSVGALEGSENQILYRVAGGVKLSDGRVAILNGGDQQVAFFGPDGAFLGRQGGGGEGPGEYAWPVGIWATPGDTVLVWDRRLHRVTTIKPDGSYARDVPVPRDSGTRDVVGAFDVVGTFADGSFLVFQEHYSLERRSADQQFQGYYSRFSSAGDSLNPVGEFPWRQIITMPPRGAGGGMQMVQAGPPRFDAPTEVAVTGEGLWVGTTKKEEILWLDPSGEVRRIVRWPEEDRIVTDAVKNAFIAELVQRQAPDAPPGQGAERFQNLLFAEELPAHGKLVPREDGGLWMEVFRRPGTEPSNRWRVFGPTGRLEGLAELPPSAQVLWAGEGEVLLLEQDELGVEYVRLYTVRASGRSRSGGTGG